MASKLKSVVKICGLMAVVPSTGCMEKEITNPPPERDTAIEPDVSSNPPANEPDEPEQPLEPGEEVFADACADCHGADGDSGSAPPLSTMVPLLSDEQLESVIIDGADNMPGGLVADADLPDLMTYLRETFP